MIETANRLNYEKFAPLFGAWAERFRPFIESEAMYNIYQRLKEDARQRKPNGQLDRVLPDPQNVFRAFQVSDPKKVKVVFYLMDPYPRLYPPRYRIPQATGIALDCSNTPDGKLQPSLVRFYDALSEHMDKKVVYHPSLEYLLDQGVLLLNTDFTVREGRTGSHDGLWRPFQQFFLQEVMGSRTGMIYVLCGKSSHRMDKLIYPVSNYIFKIEHPSAADKAHRDWETDGVFQKIDHLLAENDKFHIFWDRDDWECPF